MGRWTLALLLLGLALPLPVTAQRGNAGPGRRAELQRQLQQRMDRALREELELSDETMATLGAAMRDFQRRRADLGRQRQQARMRLRMLGREELGGAELTEESAQAAIDNLIRVSDAEAALFREEQAALLEILTPVQLLRLNQLREDMVDRLRRIRGSGGPPGLPGGGLQDGRSGGWPGT